MANRWQARGVNGGLARSCDTSVPEGSEPYRHRGTLAKAFLLAQCPVAMEATDVAEVMEVRALARSGEARTIREAAGLSIREVAAAVGVAPSTVWRWENGAVMPRWEDAQRYARLLQQLRERAA